MARKDFSSSPPSVSYYFSDHLKTASVITDSAGNIKEDGLLRYTQDFACGLPLHSRPQSGSTWGGEIQFVNSDSNHYKFTGKERDSETGLDYFGKRFYGRWFGRWTNPDPAKLSLKHLLNPQKWNKYAYVLNNPLRYADPDGQEEVEIRFDAFIPYANVGGFRGDNRGFSADNTQALAFQSGSQSKPTPQKTTEILLSIGRS